MNKTLTQFELDAETLASLVNICAKENKTPSEVISGIIHDKATASGVFFDEVKSA